MVEDGLRFCIYSRPVTLLDSKGEVIVELVEEARMRGVKTAYLLLERAFFSVECINLLKDLKIEFIMPAVKNERVKEAIRSSKENSFQFSIRDSSNREASFSLLLHQKEDGDFSAFATNISDERILENMAKEYRRRLGNIDLIQKGEGSTRYDHITLPKIRMINFMTAMILYNIWQLINAMPSSNGRITRKITRKEYRVTLPFMITVLYVHLRKRL